MHAWHQLFAFFSRHCADLPALTWAPPASPESSQRGRQITCDTRRPLLVPPSVFYGEYLGCSQWLWTIVVVNIYSANDGEIVPFVTFCKFKFKLYMLSWALNARLFFSKWSLDFLWNTSFFIITPSSKINKIIFSELHLSFEGIAGNG